MMRMTRMTRRIFITISGSHDLPLGDSRFPTLSTEKSRKDGARGFCGDRDGYSRAR